jgi:hypothetical protein
MDQMGKGCATAQVQPQLERKVKSSKTKWVLTTITNVWRLGDLLSKQRKTEICFRSLRKFTLIVRDFRLIQGVGSSTGTSPAAKYWSNTEEWQKSEYNVLILISQHQYAWALYLHKIGNNM